MLNFHYLVYFIILFPSNVELAHLYFVCFQSLKELP